MEIGQLSIPIDGSSFSIKIHKGDTVLVAGPNGSGKSALLSHLYRQFTEKNASYLPGHRQIYFNSAWDSVGQGLEQLRVNLFKNAEHFSRIKNNWAEDHFKSTIRLLVNIENEYNQQIRFQVATHPVKAKGRATLKESPLEKMNVIFQAAGLPVQFHLTRLGLTVQKEEESYTVDAMSDGERAALFLAASILTQEPGTIVFVDEPEKHLHPSIAWILVETARRANPNIACVFATHDALLVERLASNATIYLRDSTVITRQPEQRIFEANLLTSDSDLSEELKRDLIGSRSNILFVEGTHTSSDVDIYRRVFPAMKVIPKEGALRVREATSALRDVTSLHWLNPFGLIDGDGIGASERERLLAKGVLVSPLPSVENAFFLREAIELFVRADLTFTRGAELKKRVATLELEIWSIIDEAKPAIVSRQTSWLLSRRLEESKISPKNISDGLLEVISIDPKEVLADVSNAFDDTVRDRNIYEALLKLPLKNTSVPSKAVRHLGAASFSEYKQVILNQLDLESETAKKYLTALANILPAIPSVKEGD